MVTRRLARTRLLLLVLRLGPYLFLEKWAKCPAVSFFSSLWVTKKKKGEKSRDEEKVRERSILTRQKGMCCIAYEEGSVIDQTGLEFHVQKIP